MRRFVLIVSLLGCARPPVQSIKKIELPKIDAPKIVATTLAGPRVAEVLTAAGQVRDAIAVGDSLYLATAGGLLRASLDLVEEARFTTLDGLPSNDLTAIASDGDRLYVASEPGIICARVDEGRPIEIQLLPLQHARAVAMLDGVLYAGSWGGGVVKWDGAKFVSLIDKLQVNRLIAEEHQLWIASAQGLARVGDKIEWIEHLPDKFVWDYRAGEISTMAGMCRLEGKSAILEPGPISRRLPIALGDSRIVLEEDGITRVGSDGAARARLQPMGLPSPDVTALAIGDDALYVGTFDHGVVAVRWDRDEGTISIEPIDGLIDLRINALAVRRDNDIEELWVGTARGASRVKSGQITHFTSADGLPDDHVNAILAGSEVRLATTHGIAVVTATGLSSITSENGLPTSRLSAMTRTSDGALWIGGARGAARFGCARIGCDSPEWSTAHAITGELPDDFVTAMTSANDDLWIGTYSSGIARKAGQRWLELREPALPSNWINSGAMSFWRDRVWAGSVERGLMISPRQRPGEDEGRWSVLGVGDGLPSADVTALAAGEDGLWVGTRGGIARVVMPVLVGGIR